MADKRQIAALDQPQGVEQLGLKLRAAAAIEGERRQRPQRRRMAIVGAEIRLKAPDGDKHRAGDAKGLLDPAEQPGVLLQKALAPAQPAGRDEAGGKLREALAKDALAVIAGEDARIDS